MFPSAYKDSLLVFTSRGRAGYGNLDLYFARPKEDGSWEVVHAGKPVNSGADDFGAIITDIEDSSGFYWKVRGYLSSNREGNDDIYRFEQRLPLRFYLDIFVQQTDTPVFLPSQVIVLGPVQDTLADTFVNRYPFSIRVQDQKTYTIIAHKKGFMTDVRLATVRPYRPRQLEVRLPVYLHLRPIEIGKEILIPNVYYAYDDWRLLPEAYPVLDTLALILKHNPDLVVEIGSHTDCRGSDYYNLKLSFKRAQSVVNYLIAKGIEPYRLRAQGYGESQPVIDCGPNCDQCTEAQHAQNRRTTFRILDLLERN